MKKIILCILSITLTASAGIADAIASRFYGAIPPISRSIVPRIYTITGRSNPLFQPLGLKTRGLGRDLLFLTVAIPLVAKGMYGIMRLENEINNDPCSGQLDQETSTNTATLLALIALITQR